MGSIKEWRGSKNLGSFEVQYCKFEISSRVLTMQSTFHGCDYRNLLCGTIAGCSLQNDMNP